MFVGLVFLYIYVAMSFFIYTNQTCILHIIVFSCILLSKKNNTLLFFESCNFQIINAMLYKKILP